MNAISISIVAVAIVAMFALVAPGARHVAGVIDQEAVHVDRGLHDASGMARSLEARDQGLSTIR